MFKAFRIPFLLVATGVVLLLVQSSHGQRPRPGTSIKEVADAYCLVESCSKGWEPGSFTCTAPGVGTCVKCESSDKKALCWTVAKETCYTFAGQTQDCGNRMQGICIPAVGGLDCIVGIAPAPGGGKCIMLVCSEVLR